MCGVCGERERERKSVWCVRRERERKIECACVCVCVCEREFAPLSILMYFQVLLFISMSLTDRNGVFFPYSLTKKLLKLNLCFRDRLCPLQMGP